MKTRLKFHHFPGDYPKRQKIAMLEGDERNCPTFDGKVYKGVAFKKAILMKERAVLRRRFQKMLKEIEE
jgi:hypothetical protein